MSMRPGTRSRRSPRRPGTRQPQGSGQPGQPEPSRRARPGARPRGAGGVRVRRPALARLLGQRPVGQVQIAVALDGLPDERPQRLRDRVLARQPGRHRGVGDAVVTSVRGNAVTPHCRVMATARPHPTDNPIPPGPGGLAAPRRRRRNGIRLPYQCQSNDRPVQFCWHADVTAASGCEPRIGMALQRHRNTASLP